jgi:hypothetical protein
VLDASLLQQAQYFRVRPREVAERQRFRYGVDVGTCLQQKSTHLERASFGCEHQRRLALRVAQVDRGAFSDQETAELDVLDLRCPAQRSSTLRNSVDPCAVAQMLLAFGAVSVQRSDDQFVCRLVGADLVALAATTLRLRIEASLTAQLQSTHAHTHHQEVSTG